MFLVEDNDVNKVLSELHDIGFDVTKPQLELKLKEWGFRKNLTRELWRYVGLEIQARAASLKQSVVILSGRRLPADKVAYETRRNELVRWNSAPAPKKPSDDIPLYICTPNSSSTALAAVELWPEDLPWIRFCNSHLGNLLGAINFLPAESSRTVAGRRALSGSSSSMSLTLLSAAFNQVVRSSLRVVLGSDKLAMELVGRRSIDRISARFHLYMPETRPDENIQRAAILVGGGRSAPELQKELLTIIIYLTSNCLIGSRCHPDEEDEEDDHHAVVELCRISGLCQPRAMRRLVELSRDSLTMTGIVPALFQSAIQAEAADLAACILTADDHLSPDTRLAESCVVRSGTGWTWVGDRPLCFAVARRSVNLATVLLDAGAYIHRDHDYDLPPLALAIIMESRSCSRDDMVRLLLQRGAKINTSRALSPLQAAIAVGDVNLIDFLIGAGADPGYESRSLDFVYPEYLVSAIRGSLKVNYVSCLGLAASSSFSSLRADCQDVSCSEQFVQDQQVALHLCQHLVTSHGSKMLPNGVPAPDALILSAARGYTKVVSFLHRKLGADLDLISGGLSPIYAAVIWKQAEMCRFLLGLGVSTQTRDITFKHLLQHGIKRFLMASPSLLHIAAAIGSCEVTQLLIQYGAPVDELRKVKLTDLLPRRAKIVRRNMSPFCLAMLLNHLDVALLLAAAGATATSSSLFEAAKKGHLGLVRQLVNMGIHPNTAVDETGTSAYQTALFQGHLVVADHLLASGATGEFGNITSILRKIPSTPLRELLQSHFFGNGALRIIRDFKNRSYLECAILSNEKEIIQLALSVDAAAYDSGALCAAVLRAVQHILPDKVDVLEELLRRRGRILDERFDPVLENTAVSIASCHQHLDLVNKLLENHAQIMTKHIAMVPVPRICPNWEFDPELALRDIRGPWSNVKWLPENAPENPNAWHASPYRQLKASPLLFAINGRNERIIEALLDAGYKADGISLQAAVRRQLPLSLLERIMKFCTDIDARCAANMDSWSRATPISVAIGLRRTDIAKILLDHGADMNAVRYNTTVLTETIQWRDPLLVDFLLSNGASVNEPKWSGKRPGAESALQVAARKGYIGIVRTLLAHGADVNARRNIFWGGGTALELAALNGHLDIVQLLLKSGANTEGHGRVQYILAIDHAAKEGHGAIVDLLCSHRAWTAEDQRLSDDQQLFDDQWFSDDKQMDEMAGKCDGSYPVAFLHLSEFPPAELIDVLAEIDIERVQCRARWYLHDRCNWSLTGLFMKTVAMQIQKWSGDVMDTNLHTKDDAMEEGTRIALDALHVYFENHREFASSVGSVSDNTQELKDIDRELENIVSLALQQWTSSFGMNTTGSGLGFDMEEVGVDIMDVALRPIESTFDSCSSLPNNSQAMTMSLPTVEEDSGSRGKEDSYEESRQRAFLEDMMGEREAPFLPTVWEL
ncbi:ankyrin repeat-containing domain protein [Podospora didyma]|uniref:Ankyrin repeat-containing domain protein n=1 Tax=Podospora didyma TaxID=330526 RepID=A0AAE0TZS8_9PEZI|nr:ankyrin repeat-containing domain protein [Podospora didyma]